ncbi:MAG: hypothetical protein AM326_10595 [Candidatus Thorarchaeota archaeon SMTZ-45]|nr:MAG: hypothetical protein AM326_10595 [Candidatus Thorarchaeota archaeon SMTZ-45]KXH74795.1 MAG: hypothetical protein AM325_12055 [Candidatus Thorarchaeota archaeon SMTZ1-45]
MSRTESLAKSVFDMVQAVRAGEVDPLELRLTQAYRDLQELAAKIDSRIDIDEMLNEILSSKVTRVQELARILAAPEVYVSCLKDLSMRDLARLVTKKQPVVVGHLEQDSLGDALHRVVSLIDAMSRKPVKESVPEISALPNGFALETEDSVFLEDLDEFLATIPEDKKTKFDDIVMSDDLDIFLKHFLYVVILVSKGRLHYDSDTREIWKPSVSEIDIT